VTTSQVPGGSLTLILGGARSGKSSRALQLAADSESVLFVATAEALDDEMASRIAAHKAERPDHWRTLEAPRDLAAIATIRGTASGTLILDCITLWVSNLLLGDGRDAGASESEILAQTGQLLDMWWSIGGDWIVVTNEVGLGLVPATPLGRTFRDVLGRVNAMIASRATRVELLVAGVPLVIKAPTEVAAK
jgi:adenosylcobinamide kinase / adenosylcobinamide-phosphate guanylyltransferase